MEFRIVPRSEWTRGLSPCGGADPAWSSTGTPRPSLVLPLALLIVHYTGSKAKYLGRTADQLLQMLRSLYVGVFTGITVSEPKGDEYNYVIDPLGLIYEWAGKKRGAHCLNKNLTSFGVLLLLGEGETPTLEQVNALLWLRQRLVDEGALTKVHAVDQHGEHYATPCPGDMVKARWPMFDIPLPAPIPEPPTTRSPAMLAVCTDSPDWPGIGLVLDLSSWDRVSPEKYAVYVATGYAPADTLKLPKVAWAAVKDFL